MSIKDSRFYQHGLVDLPGLLRAALSDVVGGNHGQGASTITMQVARGFYLKRDKTWRRKLTGILLSYKLEQRYSKDKLLELYMNQVYLGGERVWFRGRGRDLLR
ncbi:transglycosylase domain-containing protein [Duganella violaceipulchra]|uniref:Membrane carboxypeptidase/penicillin-binding protein n=1 Tax=Duganella violaceipulchra TaxID=2849652 RepID=A0AA41H626_9BURK|nr:biosynthetic peptidoglycan transglycosylase [Duganella violaceicalia]MBV6322507.1 transglycosylase domain-containing protein [Duganella violaceicalia]MCP2010719.1 membrane carboxypeptidase/penicillin-binding protein [Duganella violaceicalia]